MSTFMTVCLLLVISEIKNGDFQQTAEKCPQLLTPSPGQIRTVFNCTTEPFVCNSGSRPDYRKLCPLLDRPELSNAKFHVRIQFGKLYDQTADFDRNTTIDFVKNRLICPDRMKWNEGGPRYGRTLCRAQNSYNSEEKGERRTMKVLSDGVVIVPEFIDLGTYKVASSVEESEELDIDLEPGIVCPLLFDPNFYSAGALFQIIIEETNGRMYRARNLTRWATFDRIKRRDFVSGTVKCIASASNGITRKTLVKIEFGQNKRWD